MIRLDVFEYCHDCPKFEADVDKTEITDSYGKVRTIDTIVRCCNRETCKIIATYLNKRNTRI